jgi:hypothetical protein
VTDRSYHTRPYRPGDEDAIIALFATVFGPALTAAQWRWKYTGTGGEIPLARLAFDAENHLVGHAGAIPLRGWRRGRPLPFFQIGDVMVHANARGQLGGRNLFARLLREFSGELAEQWPDGFAYGFPGLRPFRVGAYTQVYSEIEPAHCLEWPVIRNTWPLLYPRPLLWNDQRLDRVWNRLAPDFALALIRDRAYLHWRYAENPFHTYDLLGLYLMGRLLGWAVVQPNNDLLRVIDLLIARRWLKPVLAALTRHAATTGLSRVEIWLPCSWQTGVNGLSQATGIITTQFRHWRGIPRNEAAKDLYYTMGDLDIF